MSLWTLIKDWFGYTPAEEIAKLKAAEKAAVAKVDEEIKAKVDDIVALGQKIESAIDTEVTAVKKRAKKAYSDAEALVTKEVAQVEEVVKKVRKKKS